MVGIRHPCSAPDVIYQRVGGGFVPVPSWGACVRDTLEIPVLSHHGYPRFGFAAAVLQGLALSRLWAVFQLSPPSQTTSVEQDVTPPQQRRSGDYSKTKLDLLWTLSSSAVLQEKLQGWRSPECSLLLGLSFWGPCCPLKVGICLVGGGSHIIGMQDKQKCQV